MEQLKLRLSVPDKTIGHYGMMLNVAEYKWSHEYMQELISTTYNIHKKSILIYLSFFGIIITR